MNRILRGVVVLAASGLAWGCNTEPDELRGGDPTAIVASPEVLFIARGDSQAVLLRLLDQQGTSLESPITLTGIVSPIAVSVDSLFRPIFAADGSLTANTRGTELRIFVRGDALGATTFTVSAGGLTKVIPVTVTPTGITPTASTTTPGLAEPVTLTAETGLTFTSKSQLVNAAGARVAQTLAVAADGSTITVVFIPGASSAFLITNVRPAYAPALTLTLPSTLALASTATPVVGLAGTGSVATAPSLLPLSLTSGTIGVVDIGTVYPANIPGEGPARIYKLEVLQAGLYDFSLTYSGGEDLGVYFVNADGSDGGIIADGHGTGSAASPETATDVSLSPGTYYIGIVIFPSANPDPATFQLTIAP